MCVDTLLQLMPPPSPVLSWGASWILLRTKDSLFIFLPKPHPSGMNSLFMFSLPHVLSLFGSFSAHFKNERVKSILMTNVFFGRTILPLRFFQLYQGFCDRIMESMILMITHTGWHWDSPTRGIVFHRGGAFICIHLFTSNWCFFVLSKSTFTNPLFSLPQHIPEDLGYRWNKGWTTCRWPTREGKAGMNCCRSCWDWAVARVECQMLRFTFLILSNSPLEPSSHRAICPMNRAWGSQSLVLKPDNSGVVPWWLQATGSSAVQGSTKLDWLCYCYSDFSFLRYHQTSLSSSIRCMWEVSCGSWAACRMEKSGQLRIRLFPLTAIKPGDRFTSLEIRPIRYCSQQVYHTTSRYQIKHSLFGIDWNEPQQKFT